MNCDKEMFTMRKQFKKMVYSILTVGTVVAMATGVSVYAASANLGSPGALADSEYTLEEMLVYAMEDEYLAQGEYNVIMEAYGVQKPFSNIIKAEGTHISLLTPLFEGYGVEVPSQDWESLVPLPATLEEAYKTGVEAEENNIAMYEKFLKEDLPQNVRDVFEKLKDASEKHLSAFQNQLDKAAKGSGLGKGNDVGNGKGSTGRNKNASNF